MTLDLESFGDGPKKKSKTKYKAALGVGSVVSLFGIGSTLAANISLNGGGNVEFGQGVATTAACDEDGFSITPVTSYDNERSIFRVDYVQVSGLNLTPEGTDWDVPVGDVFDKNVSGGIDIVDAKLLFPGQYYDTTASAWKRTCDGVVLDFKAYTDDEEYRFKTIYDLGPTGDANLLNPIAWSQGDSIEGRGNWNPGFAVVFEQVVDGEELSGNDFNYAVSDGESTTEGTNGNVFYMNVYFEVSPSSLGVANSEFSFGNFGNTTFSPNAASITKITVQSMTEFPASYYARWSGLGNPSRWL